MEPSTQKIIHAFGALADLGQEVANAGDFTEMIRTSLHLLLGTRALRRGVVIESTADGTVRCLAIWGLDEQVLSDLALDDSDHRTFLEDISAALTVTDSYSIVSLSRHG